MNSNSTNSSISFAADEEGIDIEESESSMNSYRFVNVKDMNKLADELQKVKNEMSTLKNEGKNAVQPSSPAFSVPSNSSYLSETMNEQIFGIDTNTDTPSKDENKEQFKNNKGGHLMQNEEGMDKLGVEAKNDGTMGKAPTEMKCQYEEQEEVDKSGMEGLNDQTPKGFGLFHRTKAPSKLNFQDELEKEAENDKKLDEPKFSYKYLIWGTFAFFVFILLPFCIVIIRGSDSAIAGMKNKLSALDMELEDKAKLLSDKIIDLEDARKYNEKLAKELEEKNKKNEALEKMRSKELAKIAEIQSLEAKIHSDLQIKPLSGSLDLILPLHMLTASKFNITSLKIVVANFQWWATVSDKWDPLHIGILLHFRPPNGYNGVFNVRGNVNFTLKHVLPSPDCGFFVCNKDFQEQVNFNISGRYDHGLRYRKFAEIKHVINTDNGFVTLENNLHLNVAFRLTESTIDHYSIKQ